MKKEAPTTNNELKNLVKRHKESTIEWLRTKTKDEQLINQIWEALSPQKTELINIDLKDVKFALGRAKRLELVEGDKNVANKIKNPEKICGMALHFQLTKNTTLNDARNIIEGIIEKIKTDRICWGADLINGIGKIKATAMIGYKT